MNLLPIVTADGAAVSDPVATEGAEQGGCGCGGCGCGGAGAEPGPTAGAQVLPTDLDARAIPARDRHPQIFAAVASLEPGEGFVLANDHDPRPLRFQLDAQEPGQIGWEYLAEGPEIWRVLISRTAGHCC